MAMIIMMSATYLDGLIQRLNDCEISQVAKSSIIEELRNQGLVVANANGRFFITTPAYTGSPKNPVYAMVKGADGANVRIRGAYSDDGMHAIVSVVNGPRLGGFLMTRFDGGKLTSRSLKNAFTAN